jgi:hypothetical protein
MGYNRRITYGNYLIIREFYYLKYKKLVLILCCA